MNIDVSHFSRDIKAGSVSLSTTIEALAKAREALREALVNERNASSNRRRAETDYRDALKAVQTALRAEDPAFAAILGDKAQESVGTKLAHEISNIAVS